MAHAQPVVARNLGVALKNLAEAHSQKEVAHYLVVATSQEAAG